MPPKERCHTGSRRNANSGKCVKKSSKKAATPFKRCPAGTRRDKDTKKCVSALPKDIKEKLKDVEEFHDVYEEENPSLIANVRGGHKKGTLNKLFSSAKKALSGLVRMIGSPYFIVLICIALTVYTGMSTPAGKEMAINALNAVKGSSFGSYFTSTAIPAKFASSKEFVMVTWNQMNAYKGVGKFFNTMSNFMGQIGVLLQTARGALGTGWVLTLESIKTMYGKIMSYASGYLPVVQSSLSSLSQKFSSLTPYQQDTIKDSATLATGIGFGSSLGYMFRKRRSTPVVTPVVAARRR